MFDVAYHVHDQDYVVFDSNSNGRSSWRKIILAKENVYRLIECYRRTEYNSIFDYINSFSNVNNSGWIFFRVDCRSSHEDIKKYLLENHLEEFI